MTSLQDVQTLSDGYFRSLTANFDRTAALQDQEKAFITCIDAFGGAALPARSKFLYGYIAVMNGETYRIPLRKGIDILEEAHREGDLDATVFLSDVYTGRAKNIPRGYWRSLRASRLEDEAAAKGNRYAKFLQAQRYAERYLENAGDCHAKAISILGDLLADFYAGAFYLSAVWTQVGILDEVGVSTLAGDLRCAIQFADPADLFLRPVIADARYRLALIHFDAAFEQYAPVKAKLLMQQAAQAGHGEAMEWVAHNAPDEADASKSSPMAYFTGKRDRTMKDAAYKKSKDKAVPKSSDKDKVDEDFNEKWDRSELKYFQSKLHVHEPAEATAGTDLSVDQLMSSLDPYPGLIEIKDRMRRTVVYGLATARRRDHGLAVRNPRLHLVLTGNPGTGKTTVARLLGGILKQAGILSKGHVVEVDRSVLIGDHIGQTTKNTRMACKIARGGLLFIDEAYSVAETAYYGQECVDTLMKIMEDEADDLMVVAAGYASKMSAFLQSNPGLRSRFADIVDFKDYDLDTLGQIFERFCREFDYRLDDFARQRLPLDLKALKSAEAQRFANGRSVLKFFDEVVARQAGRIMRDGVADADGLTLLTAADLGGPTVAGTGEIVAFPALGVHSE